MKKPILFNLFFIILILLIVIPMLFPFVWMLMSSIKTQVDIISWPPKLVFSPTVMNFEKVFGEQNFLLFLQNSSIVAFTSVFSALLIGLPAAYSIARFGQKRLLMLILVARLMPGISFLMPWYIVFSRLRLMDSYTALILSHILITLPVVVWIMSAYFKTIPIELEACAMLDGASRQKAFVSIILPLSMPGVITVGTVAFIFSWNNFMLAQVLSTEETRTLPVAVYNFMSSADFDWGQIMAAALVMVAPAILLTLFFQKYVIKVLTVGEVKG